MKSSPNVNMAEDTNKFVAKAMVIIKPVCLQCNQPFEYGEPAFSYGWPFHVLLHTHCSPFFPFSQGWPHEEPLENYLQKSKIHVKDDHRY